MTQEYLAKREERRKFDKKMKLLKNQKGSKDNERALSLLLENFVSDSMLNSSSVT